MSFSRVSVTNFGSAALSLADAKAHMRVDFADDDAQITDMVEAATRFVEKRTGSSLRSQTWVLTQDRFSGRKIALPGGRVTAVTSIYYYAVGGTQILLAPSAYNTSLNVFPALIENPDGWPGTDVRDDAVEITYTVDGSNEPGLLQAVKMLAAHWYENREASAMKLEDLPYGFTELVNMHAAGWYG